MRSVSACPRSSTPRPVVLGVVRAGEGAEVWASAAGGRGVLVAGTEPPDVVELWDWTLAPGDRYLSEARAAGTRELAQVGKGSLEIDAGDEHMVLRAGGPAVSLRGDLEHSFRNAGRGELRFVLAVYEPAQVRGLGSSSLDTAVTSRVDGTIR